MNVYLSENNMLILEHVVIILLTLFSLIALTPFV